MVPTGRKGETYHTISKEKAEKQYEKFVDNIRHACDFHDLSSLMTKVEISAVLSTSQKEDLHYMILQRRELLHKKSERGRTI